MSHSRAGSANLETKQLRETIVRLQEQLLQSKNNEQKVNTELRCLIQLVKESWTGNAASALHVANIVGEF